MESKNKNSKTVKVIKKEIAEVKNGEVKRAVRKEKPSKAFADKEKLYARLKVRNVIELTILFVFVIIMFILLCNRTFFRNEYKTSKVKINIPMLMFYVRDNNNELTLKTLRKSDYVKDYFDDELSKMTWYNCEGNYSFYYDDENHTAIYYVDVEKDFAIKTVKIRYAYGDADCLCNAGKRLSALENNEMCTKE